MATKAKSPARKSSRAAKRPRASKKTGARRQPAKRANGSRRPKRQPRKKRNGRREVPIPRKSGAKAAEARARAADVMPVGGEGAHAASGRMHRVPRERAKELSAPKSRPAGLTREQRKKATNEEGFGFKQIEERLDSEREIVQGGTIREKAGIAAERRKAIPDYEDEVKEGGVENAAGYVDYDKQERTSDEEPEVDIAAPAAAEEE
jgi:hypothetical protein